MLPYILLILLPIPFGFMCIRRLPNGNAVLQIDLRKRIDPLDRSLLLYVFFIGVFVLLACRGITVGTDTQQYYMHFERYGTMPLDSILQMRVDVIFRTLIHLVYRATGSFQAFLAVIAVLEVVPIAVVYLKDRSHSYLKMILFVNMATFCMMFSGIRQAVAISFGVLAYDCITRKKFLRYLICSLIAFGFHTSGLVVFLLLPISMIRIKRWGAWIVAALVIVVFLFNTEIFSALMDLYLLLTPREYDNISATGAYTTLVLFAMFAVFSFLVTDDDQMSSTDYSLRSILVASVFLQCFVPLHTLAMRINYYFVVLIPMVIGKSLEVKNTKYADVARIGEMVLCVFFTLYFLYSVITASISGNGFLRIFPYVPYWAE